MDFVELMREASEATSLAEHGFRLLRRMRAMFGAELFVGFEREAERPGWYTINNIIELPEDELDPRILTPEGAWKPGATASSNGGLLAQFAAINRPSVIEVEAHPSDAVLFDGRELPPHAVVLPIYRHGQPWEWVVFFRSSPWNLGEAEMLLLTQMVNLMSMAGEREDLVKRVSGLNDRLSSSLASILNAQRSIMPPAPPTVEGLRFAVWYEPSEEVGGDYYDFRDFGDGQFGAVVADVSGHGPPASVAMGMLRSVLMAYRVFGRPASTVVTDVNRVLFEALAGERFVTAIFVAFKPKSGRFVYANAGHHVPRVRRKDGTVEAIEGDASPPLAILEHLDTLGANGVLRRGECMVLYTDGIIEAFDENREQFGVERLDEAISQAEPDPDAIAESIRVAVGAFSEEEVVDDRCVLVVMREG